MNVPNIPVSERMSSSLSRVVAVRGDTTAFRVPGVAVDGPARLDRSVSVKCRVGTGTVSDSSHAFHGPPGLTNPIRAPDFGGYGARRIRLTAATWVKAFPRKERRREDQGDESIRRRSGEGPSFLRGQAGLREEERLQPGRLPLVDGRLARGAHRRRAGAAGELLLA